MLVERIASLFRKPSPAAVETTAAAETLACSINSHVAGCRCFADMSIPHNPSAGLLRACVDCDDYRRLRMRRWAKEFYQHRYDILEYRRSLMKAGAGELLAEAQERRRKWLASVNETAWSEEMARPTVVSDELGVRTIVDLQEAV